MYRFIEEAFTIIMEHYGVSRFYDGYPVLNIIDDDNELLTGEFRSDCCEIMINLANFSHLEDRAAREEAARTLTHEYIHYLQSPTWMTRYWNSYGYWDHPYEREAYRREDELLDKLIK